MTIKTPPRKIKGPWLAPDVFRIAPKLNLDLPLVTAIIALIIAGLLILFSASGQDLSVTLKQGMRLGMGLGLMLFLAQIKPHQLRFFSLPLFIGALILLIIVAFHGSHAKGAQRWLDLPGLPKFQPSELMKLALPILLANWLSRRPSPPNAVTISIALIALLVPSLLIAEQPDLGTSLLIMSCGFILLFLAGFSGILISVFAIAAVPIAYFAWENLLHQYQKTRVMVFLNPEEDPLGTGWNIIQSMTAIGSGGFSGQGWLQGSQSQLDFLPESHTDFIIAVLSEEFGLLGVSLLLLAYLFIIYRCFLIAWNAKDAFCQLLASGLTFTFVLYIFVNMGMVSGLLPVVGVPLPFISYGGTANMTLLASFGVIMSLRNTSQLKSPA
jgi:rod shape determining protein RodA